MSTQCVEQEPGGSEGRGRSGELTLEEAVAVLNRNEHRGYSQWHILRSGDGDVVWGRNYDDDYFTTFEACAIAWQYACPQ